MTQPLIQGSQIDGSTLTSVDADTLGGQPVGTTANDIVALDGSARLPAVDGSQLTGLDGGTIGSVWTYSNTTTSGDPGSGVFRLNNTTIASATEMYVSSTNEDGADFNTILGVIAIDDRIYLQNSTNSTQNLLYVVTGITDNTGWFTIQFTVDDSNGSFSNNQSFAMLMFLGSQGTPASTASSIADADGDTLIQVQETVDEDTIRFDVGDNVTGFPAQANALVFSSAEFTLDLPAANVAATVGGSISFTAGDGNTTGAGGEINLIGGIGGSVAGGDINITGGLGGSAGNGGAVRIDGGAPGSATNAGGSVIITPSNSGASGGGGGGLTVACGSGNSGGTITFTPGAGGGGANAAAGDFIVNAATGLGVGSGSDIDLNAGTGGVTGPGGDIDLKAGSGGATSGDGGNVILEGGDVISGAEGVIEIRGAMGVTHQALGTITAATDIDPDAGLSIDFTFGAAATAEVGFISTQSLGVEMTVAIANGGQGTLTWGAEVAWAGGVAPTLTAAGTDLLKFFTRDGSTTVVGWVVALDVS